MFSFFGGDGNDTLINTSTNNGLVNYLHGGEDHNRIVTGVGTEPFIFDNQAADTFVIDSSVGDPAAFSSYPNIFGFEGGDNSFDRLDLV